MRFRLSVALTLKTCHAHTGLWVKMESIYLAVVEVSLNNGVGDLQGE
jgi:hypothetical protein